MWSIRPVLPTKPYKPNLLLINALGLLGGLALGAGLGAFHEFKDSAIYSEADLAHYIPVPILGTMSIVLNEESEKQLRRKTIMAWGMSSAVVTLMIAVAGYLYMHRAAFEYRNELDIYVSGIFRTKRKPVHAGNRSALHVLQRIALRRYGPPALRGARAQRHHDDAGRSRHGQDHTGKATLDMLRSTRVVSSVILNPILSATEDFFELILRGFGLDGFKRNNVEMSDVLQRFLLQQSRRRRIPVIVVDEAQELAKPFLEQLRLLSNYEDQGQKLLQVILSGQPEMADKIETHEFRALRQRIVVRCRLSALTAQETWIYIHSRWKKRATTNRICSVPMRWS